MRTEEPDGKQFLEELLKYDLDIGEKEAELRYWRRNGEEGLDGGDGASIALRTGKLEAEIGKLRRKKLIATHLIDEMEDPVARAILRRRYILCETWAKIAKSCGGMSERNAHYIHDTAIADFLKIYDKNIACS